MNKKTFILGVGSAKSGTTWLHEYLSAAPGVYGGPMKEYHVWDSLFVPECEGFKVTLEQTLVADEYRVGWLMQNIEGYYHSFFLRLLRNPGVDITMDISPAYCAVNADILKFVRDGFLKHDVDFKVVFLMREPVERSWSMMRLLYQRQGKVENAIPSREILAYAKSRDCAIRGRFEVIVPHLESIFAPEQLYFGLYEEMFEEEKIKQISEFLGVPANPAFAENHINTTDRSGSLDPTVRAEIERHYADTYEFVYKRFPQAERLWIRR